MKKYSLFLLVSIVISLASYLILRIPGYCGDDFMRLYTAAKWAQSPRFLQIAEWPPLYSVMYGTALKLPFDPLLVGHILTASLFGLAVMVLCYFTETISGRTVLAYAFGILSCFNPLCIRILTSTLSEPLYLAAFAGLAYATHRWNTQPTKPRFYTMLLFIILFTMTRIDAWIPTVVIGALFVGKNPTKESFVVLLCGLFFPILWTAQIVQTTGSPWTLSSAYAADSAETYGHSFAVAYGRLFADTLLNFPFLLALPFLLKKKNAFTAIAMLFFSIQFALTWKKLPTVFPERIFILPGVLSILCFLTAFAEPLAKKLNLYGSLATILLLACAAWQIERHPPSYNRDAEAMAERLSHSSAWNTIQSQRRIGSFVGTDKLPLIALKTGNYKNFHYMAFDPNKPLLSLPLPYPDLFFVEDARVRDILVSKDDNLHDFSVGRFYFVGKKQDSLFTGLKTELE